jgi:3,4-dihydroxyphenylacetate 2,3-dioxygenase
MGEIVAAIFTTHVPRLMIHDPEARRAYMGKNVTTFYDAMEALERERLRGLDFDTFVLIDTHWFTTLEYVLNAQERLRGLYTSEELPQMIHEYAFDYSGDPQLAAAIVEAARSGGLRAIASGYPTLPLHYPTLNVMHYFNPGATRCVLSMGVCQTARISNDVAFGVAMGAAIRASTRRVVLIAAGGLSHRFWDYDNVLQHASASPEDISSLANRLYDEKLIEWFKSGRHDEILRAAPEYRAECSPEGRFSHYLMMAGALGGADWNWRGEQFGRYEAALGTGQAIFYFSGPPARIKARLHRQQERSEMKLVHGIHAMLVTPFTADYKLNEEMLRKEVRWALDNGADGIVATPSIGEFLHLSEAERTRAFEVTLEETRKRPGVPATAMTSGATTLEALHFAKVAARMGYDAQQVIPPYYWRCGEAEVERHYRMIAEAGDLPLVVYHNPALSKFNITPKFAARLAAIPGVVAMKEVLTDLQHLEELYDQIGSRIEIYNTFRALLTGLMLGAAGGFINIFAVPASAALLKAYRAGDIMRAQEIQRRLNRCFPRGGEEALGHLGVTKVTASVATGIDMGPARPPYMAPEDAAERLRKRLPQLQEIL